MDGNNNSFLRSTDGATDTLLTLYNVNNHHLPSPSRGLGHTHSNINRASRVLEFSCGPTALRLIIFGIRYTRRCRVRSLLGILIVVWYRSHAPRCTGIFSY